MIAIVWIYSDAQMPSHVEKVLMRGSEEDAILAAFDLIREQSDEYGVDCDADAVRRRLRSEKKCGVSSDDGFFNYIVQIVEIE